MFPRSGSWRLLLLVLALAFTVQVLVKLAPPPQHRAGPSLVSVALAASPPGISLPPASLAAWVNTGTNIDLDKAVQALQQLGSVSTVTQEMVEGSITLYPYRAFINEGQIGDTNVAVQVRVYRSGLLVAWVAPLDNQSLPLLAFIDSTGSDGRATVKPTPLKALELLVNQLGLSFSLADVRYASTQFQDANTIEIFWTRWLYFRSKGSYSLGSYTIINSNDILAAGAVWLYYAYAPSYQFDGVYWCISGVGCQWRSQSYGYHLYDVRYWDLKGGGLSEGTHYLSVTYSIPKNDDDYKYIMCILVFVTR